MADTEAAFFESQGIKRGLEGYCDFELLQLASNAPVAASTDHDKIRDDLKTA